MDRLVIAHRGHKAGAPEQTMAAFRMAVDLGATMLEADLRFTRDHVPVMLHDASLDRTTSGKGLVADLDWAEVSRLDAGSWFGSEFSSEGIPTLDALFELATERGIALCIEAKGEDGAENAAVALFAAREVARRGRLEIDAVASFDHGALATVVGEVPGLRVAPDRLPERGPSKAADLIAQARASRASIIQHHFEDLDPAVVEEVQAAGIEVWAWPPATVEEAQFAYDSGAIGLMGDDVAAIMTVLHRAAD